MAWIRTAEHVLPVEPARVWAVLADLSRLPEWHDGVTAMTPVSARQATRRQPLFTSGAASPRDSRLGPAQLGDAFDLVPRPRVAGPLLGAIHARTAPPVRVTEATPGLALSFRQPQPGGGVLVRWTLQEHDAGTRLTQRVSADGPLASAAAVALADPLAAGFEENMARLQALATT